MDTMIDTALKKHKKERVQILYLTGLKLFPVRRRINHNLDIGD